MRFFIHQFLLLLVVGSTFAIPVPNPESSTNSLNKRSSKHAENIRDWWWGKKFDDMDEYKLVESAIQHCKNELVESEFKRNCDKMLMEIESEIKRRKDSTKHHG